MIAKAGAADKVGSLAKREMEKHGLTYDDVMAGKR